MSARHPCHPTPIYLYPNRTFHMKKILAALTAAVLGLGLVAAAGPAAWATPPVNTNHEDYWETLPGEVCDKQEPVSTPFVITTAAGAGLVYSKLVLKAASGENENFVINSPQVGVGYTHPNGHNISHIILCKIPAPDEPVVITVAPSATAPSCEAAGTLVVPVTPNVTWTGGTNGAGPGSYTLVATPATGFYISGQSSFPVTVLGQLDEAECLKDASVIGDPEPTEAQCANIEEETPQTDGFYTIVEAEGVGYNVFVDDVLTTTIISDAAYGDVLFYVTSYPSTVRIEAFALPGYTLNPDAVDEWEHEFLFSERLCNLQDFALVTPVTDQDPASCTLSGRFFLGGDGVDWFTSPGGLPVAPGWHDVPAATTLTFQAVPGLGNGWEDPEQQTIFVFEFDDAPLECLDTLAFTGNEGVPLFLGAAAALLLLGAASIFFTRKRTI